MTATVLYLGWLAAVFMFGIKFGNRIMLGMKLGRSPAFLFGCFIVYLICLNVLAHLAADIIAIVA